MRLYEISGDHPLYRWVDDKAALQYVRRDFMKGRVRHYLPKALSGLFHSKFQTGLSFSHSRNSWSVAGDVCFVVDRNRLDNRIAAINGHSVYLLGQEVEAMRAYAGGGQYKDLLATAIEDSQREPDEAFVIGDIRPLHDKLLQIEIRAAAPAAQKAIAAYAAQHEIPLHQT